MKLKAMKELSSLLKRIDLKKASGQELPFDFKPTTFMSHHILQTMYDLAEPRMKFQLTREKVFFEDGGHISLDWSSQQLQKKDPPILFLMHGLTGGSEMNYIRVLMNEAVQRGYQGVCLNSRGINNEMTSPLPFTGLSFHELDSALDRVELHYPRSKIFMVGASFGGNYLLRYVLRQQRPSVKGLVALASPLSVKRVVSDMPYQYQKFFVRRYIHQTVTKHPQMQYWEKIGLINMDQVHSSNTLHQFHSRVTAKIIGYGCANNIFDECHVSGKDIEGLGTDTLLILSKDDPIVSYSSMPIHHISKNPKIKFIATDKGSHLCWFTGAIPKRWYPTPIFNFTDDLLHK